MLTITQQLQAYLSIPVLPRPEWTLAHTLLKMIVVSEYAAHLTKLED